MRSGRSATLATVLATRIAVSRTRCAQPGALLGERVLVVHEARAVELLVRAEQRHAVLPETRWSRPGQAISVSSRVGDHADRREAAVQLAQRAVPGGNHLRRHETCVAEVDVARAAPHARFHHRRREQRGHVEHADRAEHLLDRMRHRGVVQVGHHAHVGAQIADQQHRLERSQVGAAPRTRPPGAEDARVEQRVAEVRAARQMRDAPAAHHARQALVGLVVEHNHARAGEMQLLDRAQAHRVQAADDHVTHPVATGPESGCEPVSCARHVAGLCAARHAVAHGRTSKKRGASALRMAQ